MIFVLPELIWDIKKMLGDVIIFFQGFRIRDFPARRHRWNDVEGLALGAGVWKKASVVGEDGAAWHQNRVVLIDNSSHSSVLSSEGAGRIVLGKVLITEVRYLADR